LIFFVTPWIAQVMSLQNLQAVKLEANLNQYRSSFGPVQVF